MLKRVQHDGEWEAYGSGAGDWHGFCNGPLMTDAPLARLLLIALLLMAAISLVRAPRATTPSFSASLHTPHLSVSVSL